MEDELRKLAPKIDSDTLFIVKGGTIDAVGSESNLLGWKKNGASSDVKLPGYIPVPKYFFVAVLKKEFNTKLRVTAIVPSVIGLNMKTRVSIPRTTS